jgi:ribose-phosphate pyrophosphokinase
LVSSADVDRGGIGRCQQQEQKVTQPIVILPGPASAQLGTDVAGLLQVPQVHYSCRRFPDGEAQVELHERIRDSHVCLIQSTGPPVDQHLIELLLLADACKRAGAQRITCVIPYFGYARQDRRGDRQSLGARVAADLVSSAGFDRLVIIDAHTPALEGFLAPPVEPLSAVPLLAAAARPHVDDDSVVVSPDLGAVKRAREFARRLGLPTAYVQKVRVSGHEVEAQSVFGEVRNRKPVIVDDMLSTGATIEAAIKLLRDAGAAEPATVVVTHPLLVGDARATLSRLPIARLIATDTVPLADTGDLRLEIASVAPLIAGTLGGRRDDWLTLPSP